MEKTDEFVQEVVPKEFIRRQIEIVLFMRRRLMEYTPVKSGLARRNWRISTTGIPKEQLGTDEYLPRELSDEFYRNMFDNIRRGRGLKQGTASAQGVAERITIFNLVHYIAALNNGSPTTKASHMIERAAVDTKAFIASKGWGRK